MKAPPSDPDYFRNYIKLVKDEHLIDALSKNEKQFGTFLAQVPEDYGGYRYQNGKWTVKQVIQHLLDTERIFSYRALRFARNDRTPLPGFDENEYIFHCTPTGRTLEELSNEFTNLRLSTIDLFRSFDEEAFKRNGTANEEEVSVEAIGFIIVGHTIHHHTILKERYKL